MIKCNTQANDMATTTNNWKTPGASDPGRYRTFESSIDCCIVCIVVVVIPTFVFIVAGFSVVVPYLRGVVVT